MIVLSWEWEISLQERQHEGQWNEVRWQHGLTPADGTEDCQSEPCHQSCPRRKHNTATPSEMELAGGISE
jgi:hypothetical protein